MVDQLIAEIERGLKEAGIRGVPQYIQRLRNNSGELKVFHDMIMEAWAALLLRGHNFAVEMRERPDLRIDCPNGGVYAEVTHFRRKDQDKIDDERTRAPGDMLVHVGNTVPSEGVESWCQVVQVAERKAKQYPDDASTVLVIASSSDFCVGEGDVLTAAAKIEEIVRDDPSSKLCRLGGLLLIDLPQERFDTAAGVWKNVYFFPLRTATQEPPSCLRKAFCAIQTDQELRSLAVRWSRAAKLT